MIPAVTFNRIPLTASQELQIHRSLFVVYYQSISLPFFQMSYNGKHRKKCEVTFLNARFYVWTSFSLMLRGSQIQIIFLVSSAQGHLELTIYIYYVDISWRFV